jgi:hypothetical protein
LTKTSLRYSIEIAPVKEEVDFPQRRGMRGRLRTPLRRSCLALQARIVLATTGGSFVRPDGGRGMDIAK